MVGSEYVDGVSLVRLESSNSVQAAIAKTICYAWLDYRRAKEIEDNA